MIKQIKSEFIVHPSLQDLTSALKANPTELIRCGGLWGSSKALLAEVLQERLHSPLLLVTGTTKEAEDLYNDLLFFNHTSSVAYFPYTDVLPYESVSPFSDIVNHRISVLHSLINGEIEIIVTPVRALISRLIPPSSFDDASLVIKVDELYEIDELSRHLVQLGYERSLRVERAGEFSIKGGILDVFPSNLSDPCRIEFFDVEELFEGYFSETKLKLDPKLLFEKELLVPHLYFEMLHLSEKNSTAFPFKSPVQFGGDLPRFKLEIDEKMKEGNKNYLLGILNWYTSRINNGILEGLNSVIQAVKSRARGYSSFRCFKIMAYLVTAKFNFNQ